MSLPIYIYGDSCDDPGRSFLIRTTAPKFIAEIFDDETDDLPGGLTLALAGDQTLGNFTWLDARPDLNECKNICKSASAALEEYDFRADARGETLERMDDDE